MKRFTLLFCLFLVPIGFLAAQDSLVISNLQKHVEILASDSFEGRGFRCASKELTIDYIENEFKKAREAEIRKENGEIYKLYNPRRSRSLSDTYSPARVQ